jgi:hypothetical protein
VMRAERLHPPINADERRENNAWIIEYADFAHGTLARFYRVYRRLSAFIGGSALTPQGNEK